MTNTHRPNPEAHSDYERIAPPTGTSFNYVTDKTRDEVAELKSKGIDIEIIPVNLDGHYQLDEQTQQLVNQAIALYSQIPNFADKLIEANPAVAAWLDMARAASPLALNFFYNTGSMERPSDGISKQAILYTPLPLEGGETATELVKKLNGEEKAEEILARTERFFEAGSLKDGVDQFGLTAHDIMAGSLDRIGDITRANAAIGLALEHILNNPEQYEGRGVVTASLASGAAEPVFWLIKALRENGVEIDAAHQVDIDPIALAASAYKALDYELGDKTVMHHKNLFRGSIDSYIKAGTVDVLDLIGLVEYLTPKQAAWLLQQAALTVRPGGMIVFGNMLKSRPQQEWFDGLWPALKQRSIGEVMEVIEMAHLSDWQLKIRLPEDGLYPMYSLAMPFETTTEIQEATTDVTRQLGRVATPVYG